jgi:hypothetical protein
MGLGIWFVAFGYHGGREAEAGGRVAIDALGVAKLMRLGWLATYMSGQVEPGMANGPTHSTARPDKELPCLAQHSPPGHAKIMGRAMPARGLDIQARARRFPYRAGPRHVSTVVPFWHVVCVLAQTVSENLKKTTEKYV